MRGRLTRYLGLRRRSLKLRQAEVGERVGVSRATYACWERGHARVPEKHVSGLAAVLQVAEPLLKRLWEADREVVHVPWRRRPRFRMIAPYPVQGSLDEVFTACPWLGECDVPASVRHELQASFPRDCTDELTATYQFVASRAQLEFGSPLGEGCDRMISERDRRRYGGHLITPMLRLPTPQGDILLFPQVTLIGNDLRAYRVDFLVDFRGRWAMLEIDDPGHRFKQGRDRERTEELRLKRFTAEVALVRSSNFVKWFVQDVLRWRAACK